MVVMLALGTNALMQVSAAQSEASKAVASIKVLRTTRRVVHSTHSIPAVLRTAAVLIHPTRF